MHQYSRHSTSCKKENELTEVFFASFLSGEFITAIVVNPPERKLPKRTSVECIIPTPIELFSLTPLGTRHLLSHICSTIGCIFLLSDITVDLGFIFCQDMRPKEVPRFNVLFSHRHKNQLKLNYSL